ncbi:MAG: hypothetical protein AAGA60_32085 [Cyanobacteria bacterium P01_E01_bin.42]
MKLQSIPTVTLVALLAIAFPGTALADEITSSEISSDDTPEGNILNYSLLESLILPDLQNMAKFLADQQVEGTETIDSENLPSAEYFRVKCRDTSFTGRDRLRTRIEAENLRNIGSMGD